MLQEKHTPLENIVVFVSDNCSSMMGKKSGYQKLLRDDIPSVFIMGCVCHSFDCVQVLQFPHYLHI